MREISPPWIYRFPEHPCLLCSATRTISNLSWASRNALNDVRPAARSLPLILLHLEVVAIAQRTDHFHIAITTVFQFLEDDGLRFSPVVWRHVPRAHVIWSTARCAPKGRSKLVKDRKFSAEFDGVDSDFMEPLEIEIATIAQPDDTAFEQDYEYVDGDEATEISARGIAVGAEEGHVLEVRRCDANVE